MRQRWRGRWSTRRRIWRGAARSMSTWRISIASTAPARCCWRGFLDRLDAGGQRTRVVERPQPRSGASDRPLSRPSGGTPGAPSPDARRAGANRRRRVAQLPVAITGALDFTGRCAVGDSEGGRDTALGRLALAAEAAPGDRGRWPCRHGRRQPPGGSDHRLARHLAARALRRGRLRPGARRRRAVPRARTARHGDRGRRPIGRGSRVGARDDEGVGRDRRPASDGVRPGAMAGRAPLRGARGRRAAADLDRQCAGAPRRLPGDDRHRPRCRRARICWRPTDAITAGSPAGRPRQGAVSRARDRPHRLRAGTGRARRRGSGRRADDERRRDGDPRRDRDQRPVHVPLHAAWASDHAAIEGRTSSSRICESGGERGCSWST